MSLKERINIPIKIVSETEQAPFLFSAGIIITN